MSAELYCALNAVFFDHPLRAHAALSYFRDFDALGEGFSDFISQLPLRESAKTADILLARWEGYRSGEWAQLVARHKVSVVTPADPAYPDVLREMSDFPLALYYLGDVRLLQKPMIGIVGSRKCSDYGRRMASQLAGQLGAYFCVTSGLAEGIDTAAHSGALSAKFPTVAVVGTGLDIVYPARNRQLAGMIEVNGIVISEYPPETPVNPGRFPQRNRIISGLSQGVLVIEASRQSGALITARLATDQGREVFAVPGQIDSDYSQGSHQLIQQGAKLVTRLSDILEEFGHLEVRNIAPAAPKPKWGFVTESEKQLLDILAERGTATVDDLIEHSGLSIMQVLKTLTMLQDKKLINETAPQRYCLHLAH